jgi:hypothetical protein
MLLLDHQSGLACNSERHRSSRAASEHRRSSERDERRRTGPKDRLKYIPLNRAGNVHLLIGGELRLRYE